jgi:hypothetical protein
MYEPMRKSVFELFAFIIMSTIVVATPTGSLLLRLAAADNQSEHCQQ